jgi:hypothetical protein
MFSGDLDPLLSGPVESRVRHSPGTLLDQPIDETSQHGSLVGIKRNKSNIAC